MTFSGKIDAFRVFDYVRTPSQVAWDYNRGAPVAWYKLDECQGTTINDSSGRSFTGTLSLGAGGMTTVGTCSTSSTAWGNGATGKRNYALDFDGTDDAFQVTNSDPLDFDVGLNKEFSFAFWINPDTAGESSNGRIWEKGGNKYFKTNGAGSPYGLGVVWPLATTNIDSSVSNVLPSGTWTHVVVTWADDADDDADVYINGVLRGTLAGSGGQTGDNSNFYVGGNADSYDGRIDDFRIYNYALTAAQVKTVMTDGAQRYGPSTGAP
jgi:hypothetical protein